MLITLDGQLIEGLRLSFIQRAVENYRLQLTIEIYGPPLYRWGSFGQYILAFGGQI